MARFNIREALDNLETDTVSISDPDIIRMITGLLNIIETVQSEVKKLRKENQQLNDNCRMALRLSNLQINRFNPLPNPLFS